MKYCVFCASNCDENKEAIQRATQAVMKLRIFWESSACVLHGVYEGSEFYFNHDDGGNTSIWARDTDIFRLIRSCMDFARENERLKIKQ